MPFQIPAAILDKLWPHAPAALKAGMVATAPAVTEKYGITPLVDLIDLLAQCSEETAGGLATEENLNYSASRLMQVWPSRFPSLAYAETYAHNPKALANNVYGGRGGNVSGSNDGWNFRGRGLIQLTFRDNYLRIGKVAGLDLINHPELASDPQHALECAAAYWADAGINPIAASGDFTRETIRINGGTTNMAARLAWKKLWTAALTVPNTTVSAGQPAAPAGGDGGPLAAGTATKETPVSNGSSTTAPAAPAEAVTPATPAAAPTNWLVAGFDMFESINWAEVGDAFENATVGKAVATAEDVANAIVKVATVAGVPFAGTVQTFLPFGEQILNSIMSVVSGTGGPAAPAAAAADVAVNGPAPAATAAPAAAAKPAGA